MAERFRQVHPDEILTLRDGRELAVVSEEHFVNEVAKIASFIAFAGGTMSAVVYRQPTDLKGEMATVGAVLSWADRTDARPQPEPASAPPSEMERAMDAHVGREGARAVGDFVTGGAVPGPLPVQQAPAEAPPRDGGNGAGALPFQGAEPSGSASRHRAAEATPGVERGAGPRARAGSPEPRARDRRRRAGPAASRP
jgi:hypothetical protein